VILHERRSQTFSNTRARPVRPPNKRRISDSVATRTRARVLAQQAYSSTVAGPEEEVVPDTTLRDVKGERKPVITSSALTMYYFHCLFLI
jgi:hypothetical protein